MTTIMSMTLPIIPHEHLPPPFDDLVARYVLLTGVENADYYLVLACAFLTILALIQHRAFARPPPVPLKRLPRKPTLSILFKPDDIGSKAASIIAGQKLGGSAAAADARPFDEGAGPSREEVETMPGASATTSSPWGSRIKKSLSSVSVSRMTRKLFRKTSTASTAKARKHKVDDDVDDEMRSAPPLTTGRFVDGIDIDDELTAEDILDEDESIGDEAPFMPSLDLPDSFAPLLSSSNVEILTEKLTADLIHAVQVEGGVRMREGRHEIPLDKDTSRPQLLLDVPKSGCRLSAVAMVGSDGFSSEEDLDVTKQTTSRSTPMVKHAGLVFDPPLPLSNVAPTLIHFPTLFEDNVVPTLRRIQIVRLFMDFIVSTSAFIERCLWIAESKCQIHLSKIRVIPLYKGHSSDADKSPKWRLSLSFSGHLLLFGWIPFPFINVTLPTFIIPQPHALLEYLLSKQPLASARVRRENIAEKRIALALIETAESWTSNVRVVVTPPAVELDVTLAGGVSCAIQLGLGRDPHSGRTRAAEEAGLSQQVPKTPTTNDSLSSWTTQVEQSDSPSAAYRQMPTSSGSAAPPSGFDANLLVPWKIELSAKGSVSHEKLSVHILKLEAEHEDPVGGLRLKSWLATRGSLAVWKYRPNETRSVDKHSAMDPSPLKRRVPSTIGHRKTDSFGRMALSTGTDTPSVASVLLFPEETESFHRDLRMLQYDYAFDVFDKSRIDAVTITVAATHPMLNGGTLITAVLDSIYAYGSAAARDDSILDPEERKRKRNVLCHLPAMDLTLGVSNVYIPSESYSYSDDGQTLFVPEASGGRMVVRFLGGIVGGEELSLGSNFTPTDAVSDGVKLVADFSIPSLTVRSAGNAKEFPELDITEGTKLRTHLSGTTSGSVRAHLRPQKVTSPSTSAGRNIFNPLEAYEIDFSKSQLSVKVKEYTISLGHRRIVFPSESTVTVKVVESVVDMVFEGKTQCELSWDFQGLSPILQVTRQGLSPAEASPEDKEQASLLVAPLRQGRLSLNVSSVGGISIKKAATSREDREGLYDWKFFNAIVSPDEDSPGRIMDVLHDKRSMEKLLQVIKLINKDLYKILSYTLKQVWRAKDIFDSEGISDPGHLIPMYKMARLISLFVTGETDLVKKILPIIEKVVHGDGLDVVQVKELLREHLEKYDEWAPELDRAVRWAAVAFGPMADVQRNVEEIVVPLAQQPHYVTMFRDIPSASELYEKLLDKQHLPLDPDFSNLVSRVAPYLSFPQIEFFLEARPPSDWQPADLRRIRYVYSIKRKVLEIAESYGGLSFLPQSFLVSVFLGEATRTVMRAPARKPKNGKKYQSQPSMSSSAKGHRRNRSSTMSHLRRRHHRASTLESRLTRVAEATVRDEQDEYGLTPAERVASIRQFDLKQQTDTPADLILELRTDRVSDDTYELGDSLLGPLDVAILLQAGLTSVMKSSTVVQLNQRMLLDLICSQPRPFAVAVLAEIGLPSGQGSARGLTSALMALLELDQTAFKASHQIDMHALLESWLPGLKIPRRDDYLAGGRWARQSYYDALYSVATSILDDAESYAALKGHLQRVRKHKETDPIPRPRESPPEDVGLDLASETSDFASATMTKLQKEIGTAQVLIQKADDAGKQVMASLFKTERIAQDNEEYANAVRQYQEAFAACAKVRALDKYAFQADWFRDFYRRNYDALMIKSMYDNVMEDVDKVRYWYVLLSGVILSFCWHLIPTTFKN